jgi:hypothetical protein
LHAIGTVVHGEEFQVKARLKVRIEKGNHELPRIAG